MMSPRSVSRICTAPPMCICDNLRLLKSNTIESPPNVNMHCLPRRPRWAGRRNKSSSLTNAVGFVWGEQDGEVRFHPDDAVCSAIRPVFARFAELGSARRVWLWFRSERLSFPLQSRDGSTIRWIEPGYITIHRVLENPVYAGVYAYGKSRREVTLDASGARKKRIRKLPQSQWFVFLPNHHEGYIDWNTYEANRARLAANTRPRPHQTTSGAVREGTALLQSLSVCGQCGRKVRTHYTGPTASAGYHCPGKTIPNTRR